MCGICGIINLDNSLVDNNSIRLMMELMKHRGPDDKGIFIEDNIGIGFVRLSIIDLSPSGHQPMFSQDKRYVLAYNGEIYNYIELRTELISLGRSFLTTSDSEVLLESFIVWGEDCLNHLNGMWSFVIYDRVNKRIFASRDRFGIKPFYYYRSEKTLAFASEIPALLKLINEKPIPDYEIIFDYLTLNRTDHTSNTFYKNIKKLQHGCTLVIDSNKLIISKWYDLSERVSCTEGFKNPAEYKELLSSAIKVHLRSDVPVGVCLSGGLDSSSIVSVLLSEFSKNDLNTFSAVYDNSFSKNEAKFIDEYSQRIRTMYFVTPSSENLNNDLEKFIKAHAEPVPTTSPYAQFKIMELAKDKVTVTLDGQGADEQLAGYHYFYGFYFKELLLTGNLILLCRELMFYFKIHHSCLGFKTFLYFLLPERLRKSTNIRARKYLLKGFINEFGNSSVITKNLYGTGTLRESLINHFEFKMEHLLKWEDRNSMYFSLESRVPFLDYRLVEKTLASSNEMKIKDGMTKYILRESMKGVLPEKIRQRKDKTGFATPEDEWFRNTSWQSIIFAILESDSFRLRNIINPEIAKELYRKHLTGKINVSRDIWKWINLELWFRYFID
ncbi:MAG TPA: asparagine synthase (glutamine-hydrolyzing) [Bacteroidales bacterium]|nr:asparagine synthase (glutamine-hydrolyzing) [Bacteroidales bacterium]